MASLLIQEFHNQAMRAEKERIMLRIQQGTKASSPDIRSMRRMNPLNFSNPLPDNSSGSKIRPFQCSKDESGRPNAMEIVLMNQMNPQSISGGVLKDFRYAKNILNRRARDMATKDLESQGLPAPPSPIAELTGLDSKNLELNTLLQNVQSSIEAGAVSQLTINDLRGVPRLLIQLTPTFTPTEAIELIRFIDDDILEVLRDIQPQRQAEIRIGKYFEGVRQFLEEVMPFLGLDDMTKQRASLQIGKRIFGRQIAEGIEAPDAPPPAEEEEEAPAEEEEEEAPAEDEPTTLRRAYRQRDVPFLTDYIRRNLPEINIAGAPFRRRTKLANVILQRLGINIKN